MQDFNKILSFILGLIVVIVFLVVISGKLNLRNKFLPFSTPTPTKQQAKTTAPAVAINQYQNQATPQPTTASPSHSTPAPVAMTKGYQPLTTIPSTGPETSLLVLMLSGLGAGFYLRRKR